MFAVDCFHCKDSTNQSSGGFANNTVQIEGNKVAEVMDVLSNVEGSISVCILFEGSKLACDLVHCQFSFWCWCY